MKRWVKMRKKTTKEIIDILNEKLNQEVTLINPTIHSASKSFGGCTGILKEISENEYWEPVTVLLEITDIHGRVETLYMNAFDLIEIPCDSGGVIEVIPYEGRYLKLRFNDGGDQRVFDTKPLTVKGGVFASLNNLDFFNRVFVHDELKTAAWEGDIDLDPDVLYEKSVPINDFFSDSKFY
jgi:hypothetical protein